MAALQDTKVEGVAMFFNRPTPYRYTIELRNSKMSIWMEDCTTKKQWYKGDMAKSDYISAANAIPDATAADYLKCFLDTLDSDLHNTSDAQRRLYALTDGALRLELVVTIRVLHSTWLAKYEFSLDPVSVERIDILESKLRDQQDELRNLRCDVLNGSTPHYVQLEAATTDKHSRLCWKKTSSNAFVVAEKTGVVDVCAPGLYMMAAVINSTPELFEQKVCLLVNDKTVQSAYCNCSNTGSNTTSTSLSFTMTLSAGDEVAIQCDSRLVGWSYLSIIQVGK